MDDSTFLLLDFGGGFFAFAGGTVLGNLNRGFAPTPFGPCPGAFGEEEPPISMERPGDRIPNVDGAHETPREKHVYADIVRLVDWVRDGDS